MPTTPTPRYAGLDGLRAIAVGLVVVYHLFPPFVLAGGFIGVDVFFVISGFLITTLLLREHAATGRIRLGQFWLRRARRLLPALALVVTVCATAAWIIGGDILVRLGEQVLGAFTFSYNWLSVAAGADYFSGTAPELFRNFWSLAVEEQFYVLWPLVLPLFLLVRGRWARVTALAGLAAASAVWMGVVTASGGITRGYFGTDTHAFGILLGVAAAFALEPVLTRAASTTPVVVLSGGWKVVAPHADPARARLRTTTTSVGVTALAVILAVALIPATPTPATFPGAVLLASLAAVAAVAAAVWPGSAFGPALDNRLMRWIGDRSYGIYLWHWPLLVLAVAAFQRSGPEAGFSPVLGVCVLVVTLVVAELSYRLLEMPIRRLGFRGAGRALVRRLRGNPVRRLGAVTVITAAVLAVGGTSAAIAAAPDAGSAQAVVQAGVDALEEADRAYTATPVPSSPPAEPSAAPPAPSGAPSAPAPRETMRGPLTSVPAPTLEPVVVTGDQVTAIGDSVMLASAPALLERLPGISVDAAVSRSSWAGPGMLESLDAAGALRRYVVIALGTNGPVDAGSLERMIEIAGRDRLVVLVNAYAPRNWIDGVNADLAAAAERHPNVVVADWAGAIGGQTDLLAGDRIHPGSAGGRVFADLVADTIEDAENERAERRYDLQARLYENLRTRPVPEAE
ncbi:acyltransferase family protein [Microbacterium sp. SLBN-146]|uniref:acyltransferase family protein n=1 Tax=Microbacterium sp. SLBN-146 TaxID=2768457 RepID=UPI001153A1CE|nr:acyltransferase family protein [Microbacterium sp. SLBN-146]TQJ29719.1 peptidoglycan/LPS O-acetylase OafA/YrhL [Microbacterium sp. SLBN-146]